MARILLGVTGSVAAVRTVDLSTALLGQGHDVRIAATEPSLYFFEPASLDPRVLLLRDADEWPPPRYTRDDPVLHIELRKWADLLLVAPLDAHTLAKFALGLSDNLLTCVFRAWDFTRPAVLAPAMNTLMWESTVTHRHLSQLFSDQNARTQGQGSNPQGAAEAFPGTAPGLVVIPPQSKRLACGDTGPGAMAEVDQITTIVRNVLDSRGPEIPQPL